ncbi:hypothetical protein EST38_g12282 [Candolleomyces aberdarensis]|uniref:Uncharacterized protein n=1 Tax=Candolleomyces aberdarensis TaxID=2316362 RepID=A0A4Q2D4A0_9AGAR|nr:hypothetical protein EST38_g12282 [Candolleomyces aberdarensis]
MHLSYENTYKNLISFWCGTYKDLDHNDQSYRIEKTVWDAIGEATAEAARTTPRAHGPAVPNIADDGIRVTADMYSFWFQSLGPVLLEKSFKNRIVYSRFVELVKLTNKCLQFSLQQEEVEEIRRGFIKWVQDHEKIYYQFCVDRLAACPITIHALLHIADGILLLGLVWVYWAFAMERFCGKLACVICSQRFPFSNLDNQVLVQAQLMQIKNNYDLHKELSLRKGASTTWEFRIPDEPRYEKYVLVAPRVVDPVVNTAILTRITAALVTHLSPLNARAEDLGPIRSNVKRLLPLCSFEAWGRLQHLECGDTMLASEIVPREMDDARDATYVRVHVFSFNFSDFTSFQMQYEALVDKNACSANGKSQYKLKTCFGQLQFIYLIKAPRMPQLGITQRTSFALAVINECDNPTPHLSGLDIHLYSKFQGLDVVDIATVQSLVGRVNWNRQWAIFARSGELARTTFTEDEGAD